MNSALFNDDRFIDFSRFDMLAESLDELKVSESSENWWYKIMRLAS
jgi:hypothetical protein